MTIKAKLENGEERTFETPEAAAAFAKSLGPTTIAEAFEVRSAVDRVSSLIADNQLLNPGIDITTSESGIHFHRKDSTPPYHQKINLLNPLYDKALRTEGDWMKALNKWESLPMESKLSFLENPVFKEYPEFAQTMMDSSLDLSQKKQRIRPILKKVCVDLNILRDEHKKKSAELEEKQLELESLDKLISWTELPMKLEKNDCSRLHKFIEAKDKRRIVHSLDKETGEYTRLKSLDDDPKGEWTARDWDNLNTFVVQHDWAAAFQNAGDYAAGDAYKLPYPECCFEFRITGMNVLILAGQTPEQPIPDFVEFVDTGAYWVANTKQDAHPSFQLAVAQIKAICVALEAECATHEVTRAPEKLNKKREKEGKVPLYSYHVVSLARRSRVANPLTIPGESGRKVRLHFRRGHWRHYQTHRTWIKWMLVGDPDLGFVDKEYRL